MSTPVPVLARWRTLASVLLLTVAVTPAARSQEPTPGALPYCPRHAVFRPAFNIPTRRPLIESGFEYPTKPLFLKGYAGYNYGRGPREAFIPTGYGTGIIQPVGTGAPVSTGPFSGRRWHDRLR
jgi:hypothetical protein